MHHGLLLIDKGPGMTSHDIVQQVRRIVRQKKIGHCGTLDPDATGLLLLTLGKATRLTRFFIKAPKVYEGTIRFGVVTDTYDAAGETTQELSAEGLAEAAVRETMSSMEGTYLQTPPPYCAKKVKGVKYYELARRGEETPTEPKETSIYEFSAVGDLVDGRLPFRLACSSGTYARTMAHDLGQKMGCGAHLAALRRLKIGKFTVDDTITVDTLSKAVEENERPEAAWIPFDDVPLPFAEVVADVQQERRLANGQTVLLRELDGEEGDWVKLLNGRHKFIAVGTVTERIGHGSVGIVQPRIVFQ